MSIVPLTQNAAEIGKREPAFDPRQIHAGKCLAWPARRGRELGLVKSKFAPDFIFENAHVHFSRGDQRGSCF
jgi:hypothetical protein